MHVQVEKVERSADAFQQPVSSAQLQAIVTRALGDDGAPVRAVELDGGTFHTTYRLELRGRPPVVLRVAPETARAGPSDRHALRNE